MEKLGLLTFLLLLLYTYADRPGPGLVNEFVFVEENLSWYKARNYCIDHYDALFTVSDSNDLRNLTSSANQLSWIGLYRSFSTWKWVDNTTTGYLNWFSPENCATVSSDGVWFNVACDSLKPSVCQDSQMRLYFNGAPDTWLNAKQACEFHGHTFSIIRNYSENAKVKGVIPKDDAWVGLSKGIDPTLSNDTWRWGTNKLLTYSCWFTPLFCAVMDMRGFWHDRVCFEKNPFICSKEITSNPEYKVVSESKTFNDAWDYCKLKSMNLVMVTTKNINNALLEYISGQESSVDNLYFWIGLYNDPWQWTNGTSNVRNWNSLQPDNNDYQNNLIKSQTKSCVASMNGEWFDEDCSKSRSFFCSTTVRSMILVSEPKSWEDALDYCRGRYVDLVSLVSDAEQQAAVRKIQGVQNGYVWTGLRFLAGSWYWVYGDSLQYENWLDNGQKQCPGNLRCGALAIASGNWEPRSCEEKLNFLCFQK